MSHSLSMHAIDFKSPEMTTIVIHEDPSALKKSARTIDANQLVKLSQTQTKTSGVYSKCEKFIYAHTTRSVRNVLRVVIAGGITALGGLIQGDPKVAAAFGLTIAAGVTFGAFVGGIGNGFSTWLSWETDTDDRVAALENRVRLLEARFV